MLVTEGNGETNVRLTLSGVLLDRCSCQYERTWLTRLPVCPCIWISPANQIQQISGATLKTGVQSENSWDGITDVSVNAVHFLHRTGVLQDFGQRTPASRILLFLGTRGHRYRVGRGGAHPGWIRTIFPGSRSASRAASESQMTKPQPQTYVRIKSLEKAAKLCMLHTVLGRKSLTRATLVPVMGVTYGVPTGICESRCCITLSRSANRSIKWGRVNREVEGRLGSPPQKSNRNLVSFQPSLLFSLINPALIPSEEKKKSSHGFQSRWYSISLQPLGSMLSDHVTTYLQMSPLPPLAVRR